MNTIGGMQIPMDQLRPWLKVFTAALWIGVVGYGMRPNHFNLASGFLGETLLCLAFLTVVTEYVLKRRADSWLLATLLAGLIVGSAQFFNVI